MPNDCFIAYNISFPYCVAVIWNGEFYADSYTFGEFPPQRIQKRRSGKKKWVDKNSHAICLQCRIKNKEGKQMRVYKEKEMWKRIQIMEYSPRVDIFLSLSLAL